MTLTVRVTDEYTKGGLIVSPPGSVTASAGTLVVLTPGPSRSVYVTPGRGESAFEVAARNGFGGTETEWLGSLVGSDNSAAAVAAHESDTTPHPEYDDLPSLTLIFENGLA